MFKAGTRLVYVDKDSYLGSSQGWIIGDICTVLAMAGINDWVHVRRTKDSYINCYPVDCFAVFQGNEEEEKKQQHKNRYQIINDED
jgi:hypothetical protein